MNETDLAKRAASIRGGIYGAIGDPNRCVCSDKETGRYADTPHKHYDKPPFACARCKCKAYRPSDGLVHSMPPPARHHDVVHRLHELGHKQVQGDEQGFLLSDGRFCRRKPAKRIARDAGQLLARACNLDDLYSEDVW